MAGMAIVLLCALGVNENGWQSTAASANTTSYGTATETATDLHAASSSPTLVNQPGGQLPSHLDQAPPVIQEQVEEAVQPYVVGTTPPSTTTLPPGTPGVAAQGAPPTAPGSNWGDSATYGNGWYALENALQNPPQGPSTSQARWPGGRMRASTVPAPPPSPPLAASTTAEAEFGSGTAPTASPPGAAFSNWMHQQVPMNPNATATNQANVAANSSAISQPTVAQSIFGASSGQTSQSQNSQPSTSNPPANSQAFPAPNSHASPFGTAAGVTSTSDGFRDHTQQNGPMWSQTQAAAVAPQQQRQAVPHPSLPANTRFPTAHVAETQSEVLFEGPIHSPAHRTVIAAESTTVDAEVTGKRQYVPPLDRETRTEKVVPVRRDVGRATASNEVVELPSASDSSKVSVAEGSRSVEEVRERPWWPLFMAVVGLFGSIGFNLYLGWIAWDLYSRYQEAVDDVRDLEEQLETKQQEVAMAASPQRRKYAAV